MSWNRSRTAVAAVFGLALAAFSTGAADRGAVTSLTRLPML